MRRTSYYAGRVLLYVCVIVAALVIILPVLWIFLTSTQPFLNLVEINENGFKIEDTRFDTYLDMFENPEFRRSIGASLIISFGATTVSVLLAVMAGYAAAICAYKGRNVVLFSTLMIQMSPVIIIMIPIFMLLSRANLIDTFTGQILVFTLFIAPIATWMMRGFFQDIPKELFEAGQVDGCTRIQTIFRIGVPIARPGILSTYLFCFISCWNEFLIPLVISFSKTRTMVIFAANYSSRYEVDYSGLAAAALLCSVIPIILVIAFRKYIVAGFIEGAVKG